MCRECASVTILRLLTGCIISVCLFGTVVCAGDQNPAELSEETMLMFVGETKQIVTAASRYPEAPTIAPAMVTVIDHDQIQRRGYRTLAELLADQPGFFMTVGGRGTVSYLRGLKDSVLYLYDGVPITTDVTKSFSALDREISLFAVDRVEIVRGAGSVLWGPDAFSGVVNIVPKRGWQAQGLGSELELGHDELYDTSVSWGQAGREWDAYLAFMGTHELLYGDSALFGEPKASTYKEVIGSFHVGDWLQLSGRWSDFNRHYVMQNGDSDIDWLGTKDAPFRYLKATASKSHGSSHYSISGYYQQTDYRVIDADVARQQQNRVLNLELLWDRRVVGRGLLTVGGSWRRNTVNGALVKDGFLPDFLKPEEDFFVPQIDQANFSNQLASLFGQFRYKLRRSEWWGGLRIDDHSQYRRTLSYSLGVHCPMSENFFFKAIYGSAFRSPYSAQLFDNQQLEPESIKTASVQLTWKNNLGQLLELTLFHSQLEDHRAEDPYGGLSLPTEREIYGAELSGQIPLSSSLTLDAGVSFYGGSQEGEKYRILEFSFIRPDGSRYDVYKEWDEPYEEGPRWTANLGLIWQVKPSQEFTIRGRIGGNYDYSYSQGSVTGSYHSPLLIDVTYKHPGIIVGKDTFIFKITNLFDYDYQQPDVYGPKEGLPLQVSLVWKYRY